MSNSWYNFVYARVPSIHLTGFSLSFLQKEISSSASFRAVSFSVSSHKRIGKKLKAPLSEGCPGLTSKSFLDAAQKPWLQS
jgi:hypothetical protein